MKKLLLSCLVLGASLWAIGQNKLIIPGTLWPDNNGVHINAHGGGIVQVGDTYYWFGEHKIEGVQGNRAHVGVHSYSSKDLLHWTDEGIALKVVQDDENHDITKGAVIERPKVIYNPRTKKYVMWFHLELKNQGYTAARTAVATADRVTGPYTYIRSLRPVAGLMPSAGETIDTAGYFRRDFAGGQMARDMTLFVDPADGKAYHIHASEENQTLHICQLTDDFLDFSPVWARAFIGRSMEAPAIFKKGDWYYFIGSGCTGWTPNAARSARARNILGPWEELGNPCRGDEKECASTFWSQSTYIQPYGNGFIFMADRWRSDNAIDGRYIWLPIEWEDEKPVLRWHKEWSLDMLR